MLDERTDRMRNRICGRVGIHRIVARCHPLGNHQFVLHSRLLSPSLRNHARRGLAGYFHFSGHRVLVALGVVGGFEAFRIIR